ncbi:MULTISPECIES: M14 family zinc carboxypeptidase [Mycolicibacterium]|uniref:DUF2817 domain-containing protein n=1 Tax=Mycolicibacterium mucogenicum TaxID=56689 RepID=A0A4R5WBP1_MYCMU|nr:MULTISPECIES: M14 family zinc carboxypeptidase [Mycolicibacterium]TDK86506.1 DUF2817 domain-containing protein [Mycolicibacterium mucogenicum]UCZ63117.1 DUF2817 domain-containing protein [Mycolicibacterium phocaicum]
MGPILLTAATGRTRYRLALNILCTMVFGTIGCSAPAPEPATAKLSIVRSTAAPIPPPSAIANVTADGPPTWQPIATTVQGRPIRALTVGHGPHRVLFVGGIHGDEPEGSHTAAELPVAFTEAGLDEVAALTVIEDINPDGRAAGTRGNANGIDVNRNFPASNFDATITESGGEPLSQPESRALVETIDRVRPSLILVAHSWRGRQFINFDGPAREIAEQFSATSGLPVEESSAFAPTPGSLGSYAGRDRGMPLLTIEVLRGTDPNVVWTSLKTALLDAIHG